MNTQNPTRKVRTQDLTTIATLVASHYGMTFAEAQDWSMIVSETDEFGWSDGQSPIIMWEEGPYEWPMTLPASIQAYAKTHGLFLEPVNTWALGVYPA